MAQRKKRRVQNRKRSLKSSPGLPAAGRPARKKSRSKKVAKSSNAPKLRGAAAKGKAGGDSVFSKFLRLLGRKSS